MMVEFNTTEQTKNVIHFIHHYMEHNAGTKTPVLVGISGGKDSTITAAMCVEALGEDRVIGVSIPAKKYDHTKAFNVCDCLNIRCMCYQSLEKVNQLMYCDMGNIMAEIGDESPLSNTVLWNHPSRMRMAYLYMLANQIDARVANTCNMSETYVGYDTQWGDQCGSFSPFQEYTATEVKAMGRHIHVPDRYVDVPPSDDMCGQTDEDRWGFSYNVLDAYLRGDEEGIAKKTIEKIEQMHKRALFKIQAIQIPCTVYRPEGSRNLYC